MIWRMRCTASLASYTHSLGENQNYGSTPHSFESLRGVRIEMDIDESEFLAELKAEGIDASTLETRVHEGVNHHEHKSEGQE